MKICTLMPVAMALACSLHAETPYKLAEAIQKNLVTITMSGAKPDTLGEYVSAHVGPCMAMEITNMANTGMNLILDYGYTLVPADSNLQTMMVTQSLMVKLQPKQKKKYRIYAMCTEASDGSPGPAANFKLGKRTTGNLMNLARLINDNKYQNDVAQKAVWCLTDNHNISDISSTDTAMMYNLRRNVAAAKGLPLKYVYDEYRPAEQQIQTPVSYRTRTVYSGSLSYSFSNAARVTIALYDANNRMKIVYVNNEQQRPGQYTYNYRIGSDEMNGQRHYLRMFRDGRLSEEIAIIPDE